MGDIADLMINGDICSGCGEELGEGDGYPRQCAACERAAPLNAKPVPHYPPKVACDVCGKRVKAVGLADHKRDAHGLSHNQRPDHE